MHGTEIKDFVAIIPLLRMSVAIQASALAFMSTGDALVL